MMRMAKKDPNADAARVLIFGVVVALCILVGLDPAIRLFEEYASRRPWLTPVVQVLPAQDGTPDILYKANARFPVSGVWRTYVEDANGQRLCNGGSTGHYRPNDDPPRVWDWATWLGADCAVPTVPFRVCVFYSVESEHGAKDTTDPVCSALYDPRAHRVLQ